LPWVVGRVCGFGGAIAGKDLDNRVEADKGRPDATGMQRREVRYVVKNAPENEVVSPGIHRRRAEEKNSAGDKDTEAGIGLGIGDEEVVVVPGTIFAENEAGDEKSGCPRQEKPDAEGAVFYVVLPDVEDAGNEE
jgi:hypothetical protein